MYCTTNTKHFKRKKDLPLSLCHVYVFVNFIFLCVLYTIVFRVYIHLRIVCLHIKVCRLPKLRVQIKKIKLSFFSCGKIKTHFSK